MLEQEIDEQNRERKEEFLWYFHLSCEAVTAALTLDKPSGLIILSNGKETFTKYKNVLCNVCHSVLTWCTNKTI